jgi:hypothetical protein
MPQCEAICERCCRASVIYRGADKGGQGAIPSRRVGRGRNVSGDTYPTCVLWTEYDFTAASGLFSQVAGVLAGFAFFAITTLLRLTRSGSASVSYRAPAAR